MAIEVFADIWCPFTHVGLRLFDTIRRETGRSDLRVVVRSWPLELINGAPMDPDGVRQKVAALREQVDDGLFACVDVEHFPTSTLDALALERFAYRSGAATGEAMSYALRDELFEQGHDISDPAVLAEIADRLGVPMPGSDARAEVTRDWDEGRDRDVIGSPHFFCGDVSSFCPSLQISRLADGQLSIHADAERMKAFLRGCCGPDTP